MFSYRKNLCLAAAVSLGIPAAAGAARIYVKHDAAGANNGASWANAYTNLRTALQAASSGDEVWVARGTYVPSTVADPLSRDRSFMVKSGVKLYGGFAGTEASRAARNPAANRTVLSGDIIGDDTPAGGHRADNSLNILWVHSSALPTLVDGFTIRGANLAAEGVVFEAGGALKITDGINARIANCVIIDNDGGEGAAVGIGLCFDATAVTLTNCLVAGNRTDGSCISCDNSDNVYFNACTIAGNSTLGTAPAAMTVRSTQNAVISNCILWDNSNANGTGQDAQFAALNKTTFDVSYTDVQGGTVDMGIGCVTREPCFTDPAGADGVIGTLDDDFSLRRGSAMIDAGDGTRLPFDVTDTDGDGDTLEVIPFDLARAPRQHDDPGIAGSAFSPYADMGAYEYQGASCPGDVDGNGVINTGDLTRFLGNFGLSVGACALTDLNGDGVVTTNDLVILLSKFGQNCPN